MSYVGLQDISDLVARSRLGNVSSGPHYTGRGTQTDSSAGPPRLLSAWPVHQPAAVPPNVDIHARWVACAQGVSVSKGAERDAPACNAVVTYANYVTPYQNEYFSFVDLCSCRVSDRAASVIALRDPQGR